MASQVGSTASRALSPSSGASSTSGCGEAGNGENDDEQLISPDDIRPNDVLMGRGHFVHRGNIRFLRIVSERQAEYVAAGTSAQDKDRIAREVVAQIYNPPIPEQEQERSADAEDDNDDDGAHQPGRFLQLVTPADGSTSTCMWRVTTGKAVLVKVKMNLRQKKQPRKTGTPKPRRRSKAASDGGSADALPKTRARPEKNGKKKDIPMRVANAPDMANGADEDADVFDDLDDALSGFDLGLEEMRDLYRYQGELAGPAVRPTYPTYSNDKNCSASGKKGTGVDTVSQGPHTFPTIKEWINTEMIRTMALHGGQVAEADRSYQLKAASLALSLLETTHVHHQNRVAFGRSAISSANARVTTAGGGVSGTFDIYGVVIANTKSQSPPSSANFDGDSRTDLANIGAVIYEMFAGIPPFQNQDDEAALLDSLMQVNDVDDPDWGPTTKKKRGRAATMASSTSTSSAMASSREYIPLRDLGLPVAIDALVMELMNAASQPDVTHGRYKCAADVIADVQQMVNNPDRYLFDIKGDDTVGDRYQWAQDGYRLVFPDGKLYGRDADTALLMSVFDRTVCKGGPVEAVTVSGYSGIGKTSLVLQLRQPTIERGGFFISGKFDTLRQTRPLSAIASALDAFCDDLLSRQNNDVGTFIATRSAIQESLGDDTGAIVKLIPNLCKIVPVKPDANKVQGRRKSSLQGANDDDVEIDAKALNRFMFLFRKFFCAIADQLHPVVLFFDDLQWADAMSLDLIRSIVCESDARSFLFVGSYRSNEVDQDHPLIPHLDQIRAAGVPLLNIELANMNRDSINALISDTLKLSPLLTKPLADAVYAKTSGNCLFVIELLYDLHRQDLLRYSVSSRRWEWDDEAIAVLDIQANVVDLMRRKLLRLGATEMWSVKVVACLGAETKGSTLDLLSFGLGLTPENGLAALLHRPVEEGLLMKVGSSYRFSHDQIQQAAYSLISISDRPSFHLRLGRSLLKAAIAAKCFETDALILFTCVDQLNRGSSEVNDRATKVMTAQLNLQAAKKSIASSTFLAASVYLRFALGYLDESDWNSSYSLCLEVYTTLSETEYVTGKYEEMTMVLNEIFARARTFDDKLRAYYTLTSATAAQNDLKAAIKTGFNVLEKLGESYEKEVDLEVVMNDLIHTAGLLEGKDQAWFLEQNVMVDHRKQFAMRFMNLLLFYLHMGDAIKLPLVACRMIQLTIKYGPCKESVMAFSVHGLISCGMLGDFKGGYRDGKIAAAILSEFDAHNLLARMNTVLYGAVNVWIEPLQSTLPPLLEGYNKGMACGDPEFGLVSLEVYLYNGFSCGQNLDELYVTATKLVAECKQYRQEVTVAAQVLPLLRCLENLTNDAIHDPATNLGPILEENDFLANQEKSGSKTTVCYYYYSSLVLAFMFGRIEVAAKAYEKCIEHDIAENSMGTFENCLCVLYGGLASLAMTRIEPSNPKWRKYADEAITKMETWVSASASSSSWNFEHKLCFLRAEKMANSGDTQGGIEAYENAIRLARQRRFVNEEALICEKYSDFLRNLVGDEESAKVQQDKAFDAYMKWGANRKCKELARVHTK